MKKKRKLWSYGPRTFSVVYDAETPDEKIAKDNLDVRDAHRLCLSARELGLDASIVVSQRVFPVISEEEAEALATQGRLFGGEGAMDAEEEGA